MARRDIGITFGNMQDIFRLCGGRKGYNTWRQLLAEERQSRIVQLLAATDIRHRGWQTELAQKLGVHRGTVTRDLQAIRRLVRENREGE